MSTVIATSVLPDSTANDTLTFGAAGDSVAISGDSLNVNTLQDAGGNTIFVSDGSGTITSKNSGFPGVFNLISTQEASDSASISFTTGIDSTYDIYIFKFININPATDSANWVFQMDTAAGSSYNQTMTSTYFRALHSEDGTSTATFGYDTGNDQQQGTGFQILAQNIMNAADACLSGELHLFSPSNTSYLHRFCSRCDAMRTGPLTSDVFVAGYWTTSTTALTKIQFKCDTGNFDGTVKMYGISKS